MRPALVPVLAAVFSVVSALTGCGDGTEGDADRPVANISGPSSGPVGGTVALDGSGSSASDGRELTFAWTLANRPPSSEAGIVGSEQPQASLQLDAPGRYVVNLVVSSKGRGSNPAIHTIDTRSPPVIVLEPIPSFVPVGNRLTLDASNSFDPEGDNFRIVWHTADNDADPIYTENGITRPVWPLEIDDSTASITASDNLSQVIHIMAVDDTELYSDLDVTITGTPTLTIGADGTVADWTGSLWQRFDSQDPITAAPPLPFGSPMPEYCEQGFAGRTWRVPTLPELLRLVDLSQPSPPLADTEVFPAVQPSLYLSWGVEGILTTTCVDFATGQPAGCPKPWRLKSDAPIYARCISP